MQNPLTNRDYIAELPALSVAEFFAHCEDHVTAAQLAAWFHLDEQATNEALQGLIEEGYIEPCRDRNATVLIKTTKAILIEPSVPAATLKIADVHNVVLALMWAIDEVNSSPGTAHRVCAVTLTGAAIDGSNHPKSLAAAVVELAPHTRNVQIQAEFENLAHEYRQALGDPVYDGGSHDCRAMSIQFIKDRLLDAHERLSLRFVVS